MPRYEGLIHSKLPPDAVIHTRQPVPPESGEREQIPEQFAELGAQELAGVLSELALRIENRANVVDEYNSAAITGAGSSASVTVQPTYEYMPEKILAVVITGPPAAQITLQLGDRIWPLVIPAAGVLPIGPLGIILGRSDARILTPQTPGVFTLELMGFADRRFKI